MPRGGLCVASHCSSARFAIPFCAVAGTLPRCAKKNSKIAPPPQRAPVKERARGAGAAPAGRYRQLSAPRTSSVVVRGVRAGAVVSGGVRVRAVRAVVARVRVVRRGVRRRVRVGVRGRVRAVVRRVGVRRAVVQKGIRKRNWPGNSYKTPSVQEKVNIQLPHTKQNVNIRLPRFWRKIPKC